MIYLDGLPDPPEGSKWWDPETLAGYIAHGGAELRQLARDMTSHGATLADFEYLFELWRALALRAWDEIEKGG